MRLFYGSLLLAFLAAFQEATAMELPADRTIRGTVRDAANSEPLPGVNVLLKGTTQGTTTDASGAFDLRIPDTGSTLVFSFVGYVSQEVEISSQTTLEVSLRVDQKALDEVIVVGYGSQSKRNVTGSISKIDMKQTENLPNTNISQALRGRVAGVQFIDNGRPGQNGSILIRGPRSLSGGNNPLIVLDGIFFNGSLADINPNDIESMEVLKDASAAAIYGSRAANGVVLISSKKGMAEKPSIRINAFSGISEWSKKVQLLTPERYIQKTLDYRTIMGLPSNPDNITDYLQPSEAPNYLAGKTTDPWEAISQQGRINSADISVSGKTNLTNYYLSAAINDEKGLVYNDNMKRISMRANIENKVTNWLTIGVNTTYIMRDYSGTEADVSLAYRASPFGTYYYEDGEPTQWIVPEDQIAGNGMRRALLNKNSEVYHNIFANFYGIFSIPNIQGLTYRVNYSPNYRWQHNYNAFRQDKHFAGNTTNASKFNREDYDWVVENILSYHKNIREIHDFDITLLYGRNHLGFESTTANSTQLSSDALDWNNLGLGGVLTNSSAAGRSDGVSSMFRVNYRLKNRYLATFTVRRDGSSVFAANNKYATFPSASLSWIASDEQFLDKVDFLNMLKVRVSYGAVGNQAISPYQSLSRSLVTRYVFGDGGPTSIGIYPSTMANTDLKWETTYSTNIGLDFELFKNRIGGSLEWYNLDTKDLLVQRTLPAMTGYNFVWTNLGATNNRGFEVSLNTQNLRLRDFEWSTNLVLSTNKNKIVHLYRSDTNLDGKEDDDLGNRWFIGQPMNVAYDYVMDGIYQEGEELPAGYKPGFVKLKDLNGDKKIDPTNDRTIIGQTGQPKVRWGITNNFRYKSLTLSVFFNAMQGWISTFNPLDMQYFISGSGNYPNRPVNMIDYDGWWMPENKSATRPSFAYTNPYQHNYYISRNFVRLQDLSLSYEVPGKLVKSLSMSHCRVSLSGKNIYTFTKWPGPDPESGYNSASELYPSPRTYVVSLNLGF